MLDLRLGDFCPEEAKILRDYSVSVLENADPETRKPTLNGVNLFDRVEIPEYIVDIYSAKQIEMIGAAYGLPTTFQYAFGIFACDAWEHKDYEVEDCYVYRVNYDISIMTFTVVNTHPTLEQMGGRFTKEYRIYLLNMFYKVGMTYERVCEIIAREIASYCMGENFRIFFRNYLPDLPKNMREAFMADAKKLADELIASGK